MLTDPKSVRAKCIRWCCIHRRANCCCVSISEVCGTECESKGKISEGLRRGNLSPLWSSHRNAIYTSHSARGSVVHVDKGASTLRSLLLSPVSRHFTHHVHFGRVGYLYPRSTVVWFSIVSPTTGA
ncbi:hypothetical protein BaRGS_00003201 [Batillaria attramentaria]|uniref:Uncharacterized protein n=1 Tax=Batillaria attramentaria TaxID=370345 RepID=A0ABD0M2C7_9CAEN